jgi:hypothetical protein
MNSQRDFAPALLVEPAAKRSWTKVESSQKRFLIDSCWVVVSLPVPAFSGQRCLHLL